MIFDKIFKKNKKIPTTKIAGILIYFFQNRWTIKSVATRATSASTAKISTR